MERCYWLNVVSLITGFIGNFFLLFNFAKRIRYIIALPMTIISWYFATTIVGIAPVTLNFEVLADADNGIVDSAHNLDEQVCSSDQTRRDIYSRLLVRGYCRCTISSCGNIFDDKHARLFSRTLPAAF